MNLYGRVVYLLLSLLYAVTAIGQDKCNLSLSGQIIDQESGIPLAYAGVYLMDQNRGWQADSLGNFRIDSLCSGIINLRFTHVGCKPSKVEFELLKDQYKVFELDHDEYILDEFVVEEQHSDREQLTALTLKSADLENLTGIQLADQTAEMPGVRILKTGSNISKPVFRGLHSNRLIILNNGVRQEGQYWGSEHAPEIDAFLAKEYEFVEGADALQYASDALGGVLLVIPENIFAQKQINGEVTTSLSTNGRGGSFGANVGGMLSEKLPIYFQLQGSVKKLGWIRDSENFLRNTGTEEVNYSYAIGWKNNSLSLDIFYSKFNQKIGIYRYSHLGNLTDLREVLQGRPQPDTLDFSYEIAPPYQDIDHELFKAALNFRFSSESVLNFEYSRQFNRRAEYDIHAGFSSVSDNIPELLYGLTTHSGVAYWNLSRPNSNLRIGASGLFRTNNFRGRGFMPNYKNQNIGFFALNTQNLGSYKVKYGIRIDNYSADVFEPVASDQDPLSFEFNGLSAAAMVKKDISDGDWSLSLSTLWRPPAINEQFAQGLHHGVAAIEQGNPNLQLERSWSVSYMYRKIFNKNRLFISAYTNFIDDFIYAEATDIELTIRGAFPRYDYEQADALFWGTDLMYSSSLTNTLETTFKASLVWASNLGNGSYFLNIPAHTFSLKTSHQFNDGTWLKKSLISLNLAYTMRQYRAPEVFPYESLTDNTVELPTTFDFAPAPDPYFLVGLTGSTQINKLFIALDVENLLNAAYRDYMNRFRYYADEPGINITLRLNYKF